MLGFQRKLDTRAVEVAVRAQAKIDRHENECAERYKEIARQLERVNSTIENSRNLREESSRRIYMMLWKGMGFLVFLLLTIIGYLVDKGGLPLHTR